MSKYDFIVETETRCGFFVDLARKRLWKCQLDMLEQIHRICFAHELRYSLACGSLLGAVRHAGFIPWDDDVDVMMPRSDFDKFVHVAQQEMQNPYFLQTTLTDPGYVNAMAKLRNSETAGIMPLYAERGVLCNMGIFIDIYPVDEIPASPRELRLRKKIVECFYRLRRYAYRRLASHHGMARKLLCFVVRIPFFFCSAGLFKLQQWLFLRKSKIDESNLYLAPEVFCVKDVFNRWTLPVDSFDNLRDCKFEYLSLKIVACYDEVLKRWYGDWHKLIKGASGHLSLIVDTSRSYKDVLIEKFGYKREDFK